MPARNASYLPERDHDSDFSVPHFAPRTLTKEPMEYLLATLAGPRLALSRQLALFGSYIRVRSLLSYPPTPSLTLMGTRAVIPLPVHGFLVLVLGMASWTRLRAPPNPLSMDTFPPNGATLQVCLQVYNMTLSVFSSSSTNRGCYSSTNSTRSCSIQTPRSRHTKRIFSECRSAKICEEEMRRP